MPGGVSLGCPPGPGGLSVGDSCDSGAEGSPSVAWLAVTDPALLGGRVSAAAQGVCVSPGGAAVSTSEEWVSFRQLFQDSSDIFQKDCFSSRAAGWFSKDDWYKGSGWLSLGDSGLSVVGGRPSGEYSCTCLTDGFLRDDPESTFVEGVVLLVHEVLSTTVR